MGQQADKQESRLLKGVSERHPLFANVKSRLLADKDLFRLPWQIGLRRDDAAGIRQRVTALVDPEDIDDVVALTINELHQLHEGNIARYRLRPSQFRLWLERQH